MKRLPTSEQTTNHLVFVLLFGSRVAVTMQFQMNNADSFGSMKRFNTKYGSPKNYFTVEITYSIVY